MSEIGLISAEKLKQSLDANNIDFLFDLRNADEFRAWRIEGKSDFDVVNISQEDFVSEEERHLSKFPKGKSIVTVCAHGDAGRYAADLLREHGLTAVSLIGGMDAWSELYESNKACDDPAIYQMIRVSRGCVAYLISSEGAAVVIDSARHIDRVTDLAALLEVRITDIFDTHLHADHISGGRALAAKTGANYRLHPGDAGGATIPFIPLADGQQFTVGRSTIEVIHSPGHTPGSTSFLLNKKYLFTGDTIMKTGAGRPDLGGMAEAWSTLLYDTLFRRYDGLDDDIIIMPGHAASPREQGDGGIIMTTMGEARKGMDLYKMRDEAAFVKFISENLLENPERYQDIRRMNLGTVNYDEAKQKELEIGKNLCGMAKKQVP